MQFKSITTLILAAQALASETRYQFFAKSESSQIDGHGLTFIHEGAAIDYLFVHKDSSTSPATITYDDAQQEFFSQITPQLKLNLTRGGNILQLSPGTSLKASIGEDGIVSFEGSDALHAVSQANIPNAGDDYIVIVGDSEGGIPFSIVARKSQ